MEFTLDNGLRVVHMYDGDTATVVLTVLYDTGARDEDPGQTGMAHLFEHLMFGGSANVPDFDRTLDAAGGSNNAFTGSDFTVFYDVVPAVNAETAFLCRKRPYARPGVRRPRPRSATLGSDRRI